MRGFRFYFFLFLFLNVQAETHFSCKLNFDGARYFHESLRYENEAETISFTRVAFFLSEFAFEGESGKNYPTKDSPFYYEEEKKRASKILATPNKFPEEITAIHFSVGLPPELNLANPNSFPAKHALNPSLNNLHWSQETGYIFMALEGMLREKGKDKLGGYSLHYANAPNLLPIRLELPEKALSLNGVAVSLNLAQVLRGISFSRDGYTTHSKPKDPITEKLKRNLPKSFIIEKINGDLPNLISKKSTHQEPPLYLPKEKTHLKGYPLNIGKNLPIPLLPSDTPLFQTRVDLGEKLFHDPLLSKNNAISCMQCHQRKAAFSENTPLSIGLHGKEGTRNSMPLFNLAWKNEFFWDGRAPSLRQQVLDPLIDAHEMGEDLKTLEKKLQSTKAYPPLFAQAFDNSEVTAEKIALALETFLLTLTSHNSKFDQATQGFTRLSDQEKRGFQLFMTEYEPRLGAYGADCFHCHGGALFTDNSFHNNGLGDLLDLGRFNATQRELDKGKFQTPSLRNIALTAPYMHDGRFHTLEEVVAHYTGGLKRKGSLSPLDANLAKHAGPGIPLSKEDQLALIEFLHTLTDPKFKD